METYCIFAAFYLPHLGGVENYTAHLATALVEKGNKVIIVASRQEGEAVFETSGDVRIVRLPSYLLLGGRFPLPKKDKDFHEAWRWLESAHVDHVVVNTRFYPLSILGMDYARGRGLTPLIVEHGSAYLTAGHPAADVFVRLYENAVTKRGLRRAPRYFAVSEKGVEWLTHFGIEAEGVLYNAIDAGAFVSLASCRDFRAELLLGSDSFLVVFTGRLLAEKGVLRVCDAVERLVSEKGIDVHALVAGDGPARFELEGRSGGHVHMLGRLDASDVSALLACSDVFCLPTEYPEGFPTSLLEAAAQGKGLIVTDTGGARELIPTDEFGIVLPEASTTAVADGILRFYEDREYLCSAGRSVRNRVVERFSWERTASGFVDACRVDTASEMS